MIDKSKQSGFTAVELLITLFIAAAFLATGYQLYSLIIQDSGQARAQARASNVAYDYMRRYSTTATDPCTAFSPVNNSGITVDGISDVKVTVAFSCPYPSSTAVTKVDVTVLYNTPQQTMKYSTYVGGIGAPTGTVANSVLTSGLILYLDAANPTSYPGSGTAWSDLSGSNNNGTLANGAAYRGDSGGTIVLDGVNDLIAVPNSTSLQFGETFTVSAWVFPATLDSRYGIFTTRASNAVGAWQLELGTGNGGSGRIAVTGAGTWLWDSNNNVISPNNWYFITYVKNSNATQGGSMYLNGTLISPLTTAAYTITNNSDQKQIGAGTSSGQTFPGNIAEFLIYNRALSASEVQQNFNATKSRFGL